MLRSLLNLLPANLLRQNRLLVLLSTESITVVDYSNGLENGLGNGVPSKNDLITQQQIIDAPVWQQTINQLDIRLALIEPKPNTQLQVVLSSDFARYLLLPAQAIMMSSAEKNAYANAALRELHGSTADGWQLKCDDATPSRPTMVAAIDKKLLENLKKIASKHQLKLISITPYLMHAVNGLSKQLLKATGYLALIEIGRITLLNLHKGQIQQLCTQIIHHDWQAELNQLLLRENTLGNATHREVLIYAPQFKSTPLLGIKGWHINYIEQNNNGALTSMRLAKLGAMA